MTVTATLTTQVQATVTSAPDVGSASYTVSEKASIAYSNGTGANQINGLWTDSRTLAASATENLDLSGTLEDALGNALVFTAVKFIRVRAAAGNTNNVIVGGHASAAFVGPFGDATDTVSVRPGGVFMVACADATGWAVTATTADLIKIANSGGTTGVTYTIEIGGEI